MRSGEPASDSQYRWNQRLHLIKRLVSFGLIIGCLVSSVFSPLLLVLTPVVVFSGAYVIWCLHRRIAKRLIEPEGFKLIAFEEPSAFISYSFTWPWWCEHFQYCGVASTSSGETIDIVFWVEGPCFALFRPIKSYSVCVRSGQSRDDFSRILNRLRQMTNLTSLECGYSEITDAELTQVAKLQNLESLGLGGTQITDVGLAVLKDLTTLRSLDLSSNRITSAGLQHLKGMAALEKLRLNDTDVTDDGLEHLKQLSLRSISLEYAETSLAGRAQLRADLPHCEIWPDP